MSSSFTSPGGQRAQTPAQTADGTTRTGTGALTPGRGVVVSTFTDYASAQAAVDHLSDNGFPVERTAIVGSNLHLVEKVLGRMTVGRAALLGAASGAWFGLLIGLLLSFFTDSTWWLVILVGLVIGAFWGAVFGGVAHAMTGGRRDFTSLSALEAEEYALVVEMDHADHARALLARLT
ncbi:MAG TPA: general stress protein [Micromonosporaceae bacterium]|nr:general stress protein [Micromonosporaceae bacterium]